MLYEVMTRVRSGSCPRAGRSSGTRAVCDRSDGLRGKRLIKFAVEEYPACGTPQEVLGYHELSGERLVTRILETLGEQRVRRLEAVTS